MPQVQVPGLDDGAVGGRRRRGPDGVLGWGGGVCRWVPPLMGATLRIQVLSRADDEIRRSRRSMRPRNSALPCCLTSPTLIQREIDEGKRKIVGVNAYDEDKPLTIPLLEMDPQGYERQMSRLDELRRERDNGRVGQALDRLRVACQGTENTMPFILEAVHAYATLGEITDVMRDVFGIYRESSWI